MMSVSKRLDAGSTEQRSLIVEVEGCISVKPVRFTMRLGRELVLVCIEVPPLAISDWSLLE